MQCSHLYHQLQIPSTRSSLSGSRSRVPRGTDLSERPGARDLARGSHRLGALGPTEPRSGRVRSAAMASAGRKRPMARGAVGQQRRKCLSTPSPTRPRLKSRTDLDQPPPLRVCNLTGERLPVLLASSPRVPAPEAPGGCDCTSGPRLEGETGGPGGTTGGGGACAVRSSRRFVGWTLDQNLLPPYVSEYVRPICVPHPI